MTPLSAPRISVVVPTRDRCDTLVASLRTCLDQDYEHCEIIVSDNLSNDGTKEHVTAIRDPRVRYVRTEWRLGMSQNWEFALSHVTGDYVTFVGDDDALLPGALKELSEIIHQTGTHAVTWRAADYRGICFSSHAKDDLRGERRHVTCSKSWIFNEGTASFP